MKTKQLLDILYQQGWYTPNCQVVSDEEVHSFLWRQRDKLMLNLDLTEGCRLLLTGFVFVSQDVEDFQVVHQRMKGYA